MDEVNVCLKATRNNVSPGVSGFSGVFYKIFWHLLNYIVLKSINQIFTDKQLPISQHLGIIA